MLLVPGNHMQGGSAQRLLGWPGKTQKTRSDHEKSKSASCTRKEQEEIPENSWAEEGLGRQRLPCKISTELFVTHKTMEQPKMIAVETIPHAEP